MYRLDHVWCMLLLDEDSGVSGPNCVNDPPGIDSVCGLSHFPRGGGQDPVLAPTPSLVRIDLWCADCGIHFAFAI